MATLSVEDVGVMFACLDSGNVDYASYHTSCIRPDPKPPEHSGVRCGLTLGDIAAFDECLFRIQFDGKVHRKTQTQNLGQLNPETKVKKNNIFRGHFDTYTKMIRKRRNGLLNRSQNVLLKYFLGTK